eukprot:674032-Pelagomonas_calceolata.AAC.1
MLICGQTTLLLAGTKSLHASSCLIVTRSGSSTSDESMPLPCGWLSIGTCITQNCRLLDVSQTKSL